MIVPVAAALALLAFGAHGADAGKLPACANGVIGQVVKRVGCTVGDTRCWYRSGGFCTDYVEKRLAAKGAAGKPQLVAVPGAEVREGDVALFAARAHYAFVERVVRDAAGAPVAFELAEYNFGKCWVDPDAMVTERYGIVGRRRVSPRDVDGGFLRARPASR